MAGSESLTEHYEFSSMEHIFDQHKQAGVVLIVANQISCNTSHSKCYSIF